MKEEKFFIGIIFLILSILLPPFIFPPAPPCYTCSVWETIYDLKFLLGAMFLTASAYFFLDYFLPDQVEP